MKGTVAALAAVAVVAALTALGASAEDGPEAKKKALLEANGGSASTEAAVRSGLRWLARHQQRDGRWGAASFTSKCEGKPCAGAGLNDFDVGVTSLALIAFLQAGRLPDSKETDTDGVTGKKVVLGEVVTKGLEWLVAQQQTDGSIGPESGEQMYNHALATRALCEAGLRAKEPDAWKKAAENAIDFLERAQNAGLGWRYLRQSGTNDTSVTANVVLALRAAKLAKLEVKKTLLDGANAWVKRVTGDDGRTGYDRLGSGEVYVPGRNESWLHHPAMTAAGMLVRVHSGAKAGDRALEKGAGILAEDLPSWDTGKQPKVDSYYWNLGTHALFESPGPKSRTWKKWNDAVKTALLEHQQASEGKCRDGSWASDETDRWAYAGGRVYATALDVMTLEVYYAHERVFAEEK